RDRYVDLRVRERHELSDGEGVGGGDDSEQPVLEPRLLLLRGGAAEGLEPAVDLQGVGGDRGRGVGARAEGVGQLDRDGGLPDPGGTEYGDYQGFWRQASARESSCSSPASVVLVAAVMSTCAISPGWARPGKFTVLLWRVRPRSLEASVRDGP